MKNIYQYAKYILSFCLLITLCIPHMTVAEQYVFNSNLSIGMRGNEVSKLQRYLYSQGLLVISPTGYFGNLTLQALIKFQQRHNIYPARGFFGQITRNFINSISGNATTTATTTINSNAICPTAGACNSGYHLDSSCRCVQNNTTSGVCSPQSQNFTCSMVSQGSAYDPNNPPPTVCGCKPSSCPADRRYLMVDFVSEKWPDGSQKGNFYCSSELPS